MDKKKWVKNIPLLIIEIFVLIVAISILYITLKTTGEVQKTNLNEEKIVVNEEVKKQVEETEEGIENKYTCIYNVAFFGVDSRDGSLGKGNRSDTIMICSVDMDKHEVRLVSIYRDTYLNIGNEKILILKASVVINSSDTICIFSLNTLLYAEISLILMVERLAPLTIYVEVSTKGCTE